jgi:hypothetical protein
MGVSSRGRFTDGEAGFPILMNLIVRARSAGADGIPRCQSLSILHKTKRLTGLPVNLFEPNDDALR